MIKNAYVGYTCTCTYINLYGYRLQIKKRIRKTKTSKKLIYFGDQVASSPELIEGARFSNGLIVIMPVTFIFYSFFLMKTE